MQENLNDKGLSENGVDRGKLTDTRRKRLQGIRRNKPITKSKLRGG